MISIFAVAQLLFSQAQALTQPSAEYKVCLLTVAICPVATSTKQRSLSLGLKLQIVSAQHPLPFLSGKLNLCVPASQRQGLVKMPRSVISNCV